MKQKPASVYNYVCTVPNCSSTCSVRLSTVHVLIAILFPWIQLIRCSRCTHPYLFHIHASLLQSQRNISRVVGYATDKPPWFAADYANRRSSGSLSTHVVEAIWLLEQSHTGMEEKGVSQEQLGNIRGSLERMKRVLELLGKATEVVQKGLRKFKWTFTGE
jgi:hypothetical protein